MLSTLKKKKIEDVFQSIGETHFGRDWPPEYSYFYGTWGFFNSIYDTLYRGKEWERVAKFALDPKFTTIWYALSKLNELEELARQACVGDGRNDYLPSEKVRVAFNTLRTEYGVALADVCQNLKCVSRQKRGQQMCLQFVFSNPPQSITNPGDAIYTPFGATLLIIYQIRNNLFHGSKNEFFGPEYDRNKLLVKNAEVIVRKLLELTQPLLV